MNQKNKKQVTQLENKLLYASNEYYYESTAENKAELYAAYIAAEKAYTEALAESLEDCEPFIMILEAEDGLSAYGFSTQKALIEKARAYHATFPDVVGARRVSDWGQVITTISKEVFLSEVANGLYTRIYIED